MKAIKEVKPIEHYLNAVYPVTVYPAPEGGYVAEIEDLPGCITEGETLEEVFQNIEGNRRTWIEVQHEDGVEIPLPRNEQEHSGRFLIRIPKGLHRKLAEQARREGVSLNQYVETVLATRSALKDITAQIDEKLSALIMERVSPYPTSFRYVFKKDQEEELPQRRMINEAVML